VCNKFLLLLVHIALQPTQGGDPNQLRTMDTVDRGAGEWTPTHQSFVDAILAAATTRDGNG